jgi:hypothetical protein
MRFSENTSLIWYYQAKPVYAAQDSQALAQIIHANVGLPRCDLTSSSSRLFEQLRHTRARAKQAALEAKVDAPSNSDVAPHIASATLLFTLSVLVILAGILTPFARQQYYDAQIQQLEATYPPIRDPLTSDTLGWTPAPPDAAGSFMVSSNGYAFTSVRCCALSSQNKRRKERWPHGGYYASRG